MVFDIRETTLARVVHVRHHILRPHQTPEETISQGDLHPDAIHLGAYSDESLIGVLSAGPEPFPHKEVARCWRLRGFAVYPECRGRGIGSSLVERIISLLKARECSFVWGLARLSVLEIYSRAGFRTYGDVFDIDRVGPHHTIVSQLRESNFDL
jgi:GNAT superfamily N-acetyltransferase